MPLNPGLMRFSLRIDQRSSSQDASGGQVDVWNQFHTCRAQIERTPGSEIWDANQRQGRVPVVFGIRYFPGVLPSMRVIFKRDGIEKVHNIISAIDPDGLRVELLLTTQELVEEVP